LRAADAARRDRGIFIEGLVVGDTFVRRRGGALRGAAEDQVSLSRANDKDAKVPSYMGGKFPLSTYLAERVRKLLADRRAWNGAAGPGARLAVAATDISRVPGVRELLVETFPRANKHYLVCYPSRAGWRTRRWACC
jgi:ATP-dependent Lhr-like helicase